MPFKELPFNRIIVIDDEPVATFIAQTILQRANLAHQVQLYNDPEQALLFLYTHYAKASPLPDSTRDLILLDLNMPVMSGFDLLEALKSSVLNLSQHSSAVVFYLGSGQGTCQ